LSKQKASAPTKPSLSGVAKYLETQEQKAKKKPAISSVSKYITNQSLLSKNSPAVSGVAKYVKKQSLTVKTKAATSVPVAGEETGVAKYLKQLPTTDVAAEEQSSLVEKTIEGEFIPASEAAEQTGQVKDIEETLKKPSAKKTKKTGVSKYLDEQNAARKKPKTAKQTGVEKYLMDLAAS
jgi:hypothetical protein